MKIYVLRHEKRFSSPSFDTTLKEEGIEDAKKLSLLLNKLEIDLIYCSPFKRVIQTIEPFLEKTNKKVNIENSLYEYINEYDFTKEDIKHVNQDMYGYKYFNNDYKSFYNLDNLKYPEIRCNLEDRVNNFTSFLKSNNLNSNILLVTHMSPVNVIINKNKRFPYPQGGLTLIYDNEECYIPKNY